MKEILGWIGVIAMVLSPIIWCMFFCKYRSNFRSKRKADEKISIEFTGAEFDEILKYQGYAGATTVQNAVMNAISIAFDDADWT